MHKPILLLLSLSLSIRLSNLTAQKKYDYYWPFGIDQKAGPEFQALEFDFSQKPFDYGIRTAGLEYWHNNASICDKDGQLLFYTNGCAVANRAHEIMPNGEGINDGPFFQILVNNDCTNGYPGAQDIMILPDPAYDQGYYIISKPKYYTPGSFASAEAIKYSYLDMALDNGMGNITTKDSIVFEENLIYSYLTAIPHNNGKDWWIIDPDRHQGFHRLLLDEDGIQHQAHQVIGPPVHWNASGAGHAKFSPDGTKYAYYNQVEGLSLYDFDRDDGTLSNLDFLPLFDPEDPSFATCEWSPNSRFLYLTNYDTLWQLDIWEEDLQEGLVFIDSRKDTSALYVPYFQASNLGPDCRIYLRGLSGSYAIHLIHHPDEKGAACQFEQEAIKFPIPSGADAFPNFPRFRVDEEEKCDPSILTVLGEPVYWRRDMVVYPNPAIDQVTVELPEDVINGHLYIINMEGQVVQQVLVDQVSGSFQMAMGALPVGSYSVELIPTDNKEQVVYTARVQKVK